MYARRCEAFSNLPPGLKALTLTVIEIIPSSVFHNARGRGPAALSKMPSMAPMTVMIAAALATC